MHLTLIDWSAVAAYLLITVVLGLYFRRRSGRDMAEYFVSGREVSWWLAGTSMVATTFAADTPLLVTGLVYSQGIAGNWLWWSFLPSGMMTVFLFARLWRRSGLLTDVQFAEMRYGGKPAAFLRGFRAIYLGLLMNCLILGWVTKAMITITQQLLGLSPGWATIICVVVLIPFTGLYVSLGGLWGVLWTDLFQFVLKMAIVIAVAYYGIHAAGGMSAVLEKLRVMQAHSPGAGAAASFFPHFSRGLTAEPMWTVPALTFLVFLCLQWWAFWYPGAEPGGGGYIAQRIFSAKDERHGLLSVLWFNIAHYALRPWPWILTGLAVIVLYPRLEHPEQGYMMVVTDHVPHTLIGVIIAGFLAAFMSTVATQLNWGASYLIADFYRRFIHTHASESHYVNASRAATVLLVALASLVAWQLSSIRSGWTWVLELGAGTGAVYLLRWYWWRINAWSEIAAMATALAVSLMLHAAQFFSGSATVVFAKNALWTTGLTTLAWLLVTFTTAPEPEQVLTAFYRKVRPDVRGWRPIAALAPGAPATRDLGRNLLAWLLGCGMVYAALFGVGKIILLEPGRGLALLAVSIACALALYRDISHRSWREPEQDAAAGK
ncbi:MAG: Na+:solute symporter [Acidobacteria bacterium]|nr:Na+:solute symporter [Acidobacteriota bacterium]